MILSFGYFIGLVIRHVYVCSSQYFPVWLKYVSSIKLMDDQTMPPSSGDRAADRASAIPVTSFPSTLQGNDSVSVFFSYSSDVCDPNAIYGENCFPIQSNAGDFFVHLISLDTFSSLNLL